MSSTVPSRPFILYVDDEYPNRLVFEHALTELDVGTAESGEAALEVFAAREVAVLVTDMRMPTMTGEELLRIVKDRYPDTLRIVLTAFDDVGPILRAINDGLVARYIVKPWNQTELVQVLRWACETWRLARASSELYQRALAAEHLINLGTLAALAVHDLQGPLLGLGGELDDLRRLAASSNTLRAAVAQAPFDIPERAELLRITGGLDATVAQLATGIEHLTGMIRDLKRLGKPLDATEIGDSDPVAEIRRVIATCADYVISARGTIVYDGPQSLPAVRMSPLALRSVLINVVRNGAQALAQPGGRISIGARDDAGMVAVEVRDNGIGMPADVLDRIGTPFFTTRETGTGLGLTQCHRLLGPAGGRLRVESEPGVGTTVTILVPTVAMASG